MPSQLNYLAGSFVLSDGSTPDLTIYAEEVQPYILDSAAYYTGERITVLAPGGVIPTSTYPLVFDADGTVTYRFTIVRDSDGVVIYTTTKSFHDVAVGAAVDLITTFDPLVTTLGVVVEAIGAFRRADGTAFAGTLRLTPREGVFANVAKTLLILPIPVTYTVAQRATKPISGATNANPCVITALAHGYVPGDTVAIAGVVGMHALNSLEYVVGAVATNTFELAGVDSSGFDPYPAFAVSGATKANPCVITAVGHTYAIGDTVVLSGLGGMTEVNGGTFTVGAIAVDEFELAGIDSTGFTAYTTGGTASLGADGTVVLVSMLGRVAGVTPTYKATRSTSLATRVYTCIPWIYTADLLDSAGVLAAHASDLVLTETTPASGLCDIAKAMAAAMQ